MKKDVNTIWILVFTSFLFLLTSLFATRLCCRRLCRERERILKTSSLLNVVVSLLSSLHWYDYRDGMRREADKVLARAAFTYYTILGAMYMTHPSLRRAGWTVWVIMLLSYLLSKRIDPSDEKKTPKKKGSWMYAHACFHLCAILGQCLILEGVATEV